jgi:FkbM family methyltransferase
MKIQNLSSQSKIQQWINKSVAECKASYPLIQKKLPVAVDIGANVGGFCIHAREHFDKIYAFEPYVPNYNILLQVKEQLNMDNIEIFNTAVTGKSNEKLLLKANQSEHSGDISCADFKNDNFTNLNETCETISLADLMDVLEIERINYLKLDCEGSEYEILEKFRDHHKISIIVMELHEYWGPSRKKDLLQSLNEFYYIVPSLRPQALELANVKKHALSDFKQLKGENNFFCLNRRALRT